VITGAGIAAAATLGVAGTAVADSYTYYVGSNADTTGSTDCLVPDNTTCTLRDALYAANDNSGNTDYVVFNANVSGAVTLNGSDILIDDPVYIYGRGPDVDTVSGHGDSRIFDIDMTNAGASVLIDGLTLADGAEVADSGGAIYDKNADLSIVDSVLTGNEAVRGGAIYEYGGANHGRDLFVIYSTLDHNTADRGGAIAGYQSTGVVGVSTLADNTAHDVGGGIFSGSPEYGARLYDSTVSGNFSENGGGGLVTFYAYAYNTIAANSAGSPGTDTYNLYLYTFGSLIENPGTQVYGERNILGADPQLGSLGNNGGNTPTLKPAASSPVVDQGFGSPGLFYDQRGSQRIVDNPNVANAIDPPYGGADIGSVELTLEEGPQAAPSPPPAPPPQKKKKKCKKKKHKRSAGAAKKKKCKRKKKHHRSVRPAARVVEAWRARAAAHPAEHHWGDRAWKFGR
jgi:hypothetical protein